MAGPAADALTGGADVPGGFAAAVGIGRRALDAAELLRADATATGERHGSNAAACRAAADRTADAGIPRPVACRPETAARLVESVRTDLVGHDGQATATAVRVIWTRDHVDVARRLQPSLAAAVDGGALR